jgi:hypothetical protein
MQCPEGYGGFHTEQTDDGWCFHFYDDGGALRHRGDQRVIINPGGVTLPPAAPPRSPPER